VLSDKNSKKSFIGKEGKKLLASVLQPGFNFDFYVTVTVRGKLLSFNGTEDVAKDYFHFTLIRLGQ
jgi:hypothetical protein